MTDALADHTAALLDAARAEGAAEADAVAVEGISISIDVRAGRLEQAERAEGIDLGLRVIVDGRQACVSSSDSRPETLREMARRAVAMAREAPRDPYAGLAAADQLARSWDMAALDLDDPSPEPAPAVLEDLALAAEAAALAVPGVRVADSASAGYGRRVLHLAASNGFAGGYARSSHMLSCVAITGDGTAMERDWHAEGRVHAADMPPPDSVGTTAGQRTVARRGARKPPTGSFPVVYDERVAGSLIGHLLGAINGTAIARGASWLREALGETVLPEGMDLREDPHRPRIGASRPFDAEGLATAPRVLVGAGVLQGWVLDLGTARKLWLESTANAMRGPSAPPAPGTTSVALTQGDATQADLMRDMGSGLLITSLIGASINPTTGDYSRGASGFWVEKGEIAYPVNECTVAGNLRDMLRSLVAANDARPHVALQVPSLLVGGVTIAGA